MLRRGKEERELAAKGKGRKGTSCEGKAKKRNLLRREKEEKELAAKGKGRKGTGCEGERELV